MRDTPYAKELARAEVNDCRIERLWVKKLGQIEIRFSWWPSTRLVTRPLDLPEHELLELLRRVSSLTILHLAVGLYCGQMVFKNVRPAALTERCHYEVKPALNRHKFETAGLVLGGKRSQMLLPFIIQLAKRIFAVLL
jgi:hypothetical protein